MDNTTKFAPLVKRTLRELRILYSLIATQVKRTSQQIDAIRSENERNRYKEIPTKVGTEAVFFEDAIVRKPQRGKDRNERTQDSIKHAAWATFAAVFLYAGITALQWNEMRKATEKAGISADAAKRAADTASLELELSQRPWLSVKALVYGPLFSDSDSLQLLVKFIIENFGRSPAIRVKIRYHFLPSQTWIVVNNLRGIDILDYQRLICDQQNPLEAEENGAIVASDNPPPSVVFPSDHVFSTEDIFIHWRDVPRELLSPVPMLTPTLVGCVDYFSGSLEKPYQTGFLYWLHQHPYMRFAVDIKQGKIPASDLWLEQQPGGEYAK